MISVIPNDMAPLFSPQFAPFLTVTIAIIYVMVGQIIRLTASPIFLGVALLLSGAWVLGFFGASSRTVTIFGLSFDNLTWLSFQILFPAVLGVSLTLFYKVAPENKKSTSLLLLLLSFLGGMVVLTSSNWMVFFVGLQCLSIPIYGLLAFDTENKMALSSSIRYLMLSMIAMAFMLFGILMLYADTKTMDFLAIYQATNFGLDMSRMMLIGCALIFVGIGFKISLAPFHVWAPEVYQGASLFVTSYLLVIVKAVVLFFLVRNFSFFMGVESTLLSSALSVMAIISMWLGNGLMFLEKNFMRFLGFLSIGHIGFLCLPLLSRHPFGAEAIFIDLAAFGLAILLVITSIKLLSGAKPWSMDDFKGLAHSHPGYAFLLSVGLISLAGLPLTAGFIGKYAILRAGLSAHLWTMAIHMVLSSILGILAIFRIIIAMFQPSAEPLAKFASAKNTGALFAMAFLLIFFGVFPAPWLNWIKAEINPFDIILSKSTSAGEEHKL